MKRKVTAWMLLASLIVISIFVTSATWTYAANRPVYPVTLKIFRGATSGVGAVKVQDITQNNRLTGCIRTPNQGQFVTVTDFAFQNQDRININTFSDAQCNNGTGQPYQNDLVRHLKNCGHLCRDFETT